MNKKTVTLGLLAGVIGMTGLAGSTYAAEGEGREHGGERGPRVELSEDVREELHETFADGDYDAYVEVAEENDLRVMDEDQFDERSDHAAEREASKEAVLDGDYSAWRSIVGEEKMTDIDADNFYLLTDMANARESGDEDAMAEARDALEAAGVEKPEKGHRGGDRGGEGRGEGEHGEGRGIGGELNAENVSELSNDEKEDLLDRLIEMIKLRLGLS